MGSFEMFHPINYHSQLLLMSLLFIFHCQLFYTIKTVFIENLNPMEAILGRAMQDSTIQKENN